MEKNFLKIIIAAFVVLAIIASFPWLDEKLRGERKNKQSVSGIDFSVFSKESTDKIIIKKGDDEKKIVFRNEKWLIGEDQADENKIGELFEDFSVTRLKEVASQNEANYAKFGVEKDSAIQLILTQNGQDSTFFIGKAGPAASEFYARKDGFKNVYLMGGDLREKLLWEQDKWKKEEDGDGSEGEI